MKIWIWSTPSMAAFGWCFWTFSWLVKMKTTVKMQIHGPHHDTCMFFYTNQGKYERGGNCGKYVGYYWQRQLVGDQLWGRLCLTTQNEKWKLPKTIGCRNLWKIIFLQQMCSTISKLPFSTTAQPNWSFVEICIWYVYGHTWYLSFFLHRHNFLVQIFSTWKRSYRKKTDVAT